MLLNGICPDIIKWHENVENFIYFYSFLTDY